MPHKFLPTYPDLHHRLLGSEIATLADFGRAKVGDHFSGRFCRPPSPTSGRTHRNPGRFQVLTGGFTTDARGLLNSPQRPAQPSQC